MPLYARGARPQYTAKCEKRRGEEEEEEEEEEKKKRKKGKEGRGRKSLFFSVGTARAGDRGSLPFEQREVIEFLVA